MRAVVCSAYGEPEDLELLEIPVPATGPGQVLVGVEAAAVNFPDLLLIANRYQITVPLPFIPGSEFAGKVLQAADDVAGCSVGDRVFGSTMVGAFAEAVAVPASSLTAVPGGVQSSHAAAFGVAHRTAYHVLRSVASLEAGEELLVLGAGGGVGLAAVQLGALLGANVTAVASSPEKLEVARLEGAARTIDYRAGDLRHSLRELLPHGADVVLDPVGGALSEPALRSLRWGGRFVTVGYASGEIPRIPLNLVLLKGVHILGFQFRDFAAHASEEMARNDEELLGLLGSKRVRPYIGTTFPLEGATEALRRVADGRAVGKVVVEVRSTLL
jgi:NADPH2:quinone reductase